MKIFGFTIFNAFVKSVRSGRWTNDKYIHVVSEYPIYEPTFQYPESNMYELGTIANSLGDS